jgi:hypothetical protein
MTVKSLKINDENLTPTFKKIEDDEINVINVMEPTP